MSIIANSEDKKGDTRPLTAVFSTSDIFTFDSYHKNYDTGVTLQHEKKVEVGVHQLKMYVYSTGRLEKALDEGYTVLIGTTREELSKHDKWWIELVGEENVFVTRKTIGLGDSTGNAYWRIFDKLQISWPINADGSRLFWHAALNKLTKRGIKQGRDFIV